MPGARLTLEEREAISRGLVAKQSLRAIAETDRTGQVVDNLGSWVEGLSIRLRDQGVTA